MSHTPPQIRPVSRGGKTASETLFEQYLDLQQIEYEFEPPIADKKKHPDYRLFWRHQEIFCEVKELRTRRPRPQGAAHFDPYGGIRKEIHEARKQFKEYKNHPCVLILHNIDDWEFRDWPEVIFGAMLGNLGIQFPYEPQQARALTDGARSVFLKGGKMIDARHGQSQNTTFSAVAVLSIIRIPNPAFEREYERRLAAMKKARGVELAIEECLRIRMGLYEQIPCTLGDQPRLSMFENPFARKPLPSDVFTGPYDSRVRFNRSLGKIERTYAGEGLIETERLSQNEGDVLQRIERFKQGIVDRFRPKRIVLFGSHAYGCAEPESDVDLLVVFAGSGSAADRSLEILKAVPCDFAVDLLTRTEGEIAHRISLNDPFFHEIRERGKVLYESSGA